MCGKLVLLFCLLGLNTIAAQESHAGRIDAAEIDHFFASHKEYGIYRSAIDKLYAAHPQPYWFRGNAVSGFGIFIYGAACNLSAEGLPETVPYRSEAAQVFKNDKKNAPKAEDDLLLSCLYLYYADKVFKGLPVERIRETGWDLPLAKPESLHWLASPATAEAKLISGANILFSPYYRLRSALRKYRKIEQDGGWEKIPLQMGTALHPDEASRVVGLVRKRLYAEGYLLTDNQSDVFDAGLCEAVSGYRERHGMMPNALIDDALIASLNLPVGHWINCIAVNMERCRWIGPQTVPDYIAVNIPSFRLHYFRDETPIFTSNVVVGREMNKTVVFSATLNQIVFNPYWNVPSSILKKEILPALKRNPNYLKLHHMEWHNGSLRQQPGNDNALGRVKFLFPNSNNIYLHDTPQKSLFKAEKRAFSHGCIRVEKACELAALLMRENFGWTESQTIEAMAKEQQKGYLLKKQLPVYIVYFTAWADQSGNVSFFPDIYKRDNVLAGMLFGPASE